MKRCALGLLCALALSLCAVPLPTAQAHTGALAALELRATGTQVLAAWSADDFASQGGLPAPQLQGCSLVSPAAWTCPEELDGVVVIASELAEKDGQVVVSVVRDGAVVRGVLDPRSPAWDVPAPGAAQSTMADYFVQGLHHIAGGIDHLVFVLGLLLLAPSARALLGVVTAFTLGHSVTLGVATLTGVAPASAPTEALIAGSILLLARELVVSRRQGRAGRHPAGLAAVFGLAHGFGFSGALAEVGIASGDMAPALLGFNLGVEAGQLVFVAAIAALAGLAHCVAPTTQRRLVTATPWAIGAIAGYWFVERVAALG